jgi:alanyl-tRNA synthetase
VIVLASAGGESAAIVVSVGPSLTQRGLRAGDLAKAAAAVLGGGGGGRDTLARAGGPQIQKIDEALAAARAAVEAVAI